MPAWQSSAAWTLRTTAKPNIPATNCPGQSKVIGSRCLQIKKDKREEKKRGGNPYQGEYTLTAFWGEDGDLQIVG